MRMDLEILHNSIAEIDPTDTDSMISNINKLKLCICTLIKLLDIALPIDRSDDV